jgi:C1A family cysteine protease
MNVMFTLFMLLAIAFANEMRNANGRFNKFINDEVVRKIKESGAKWIPHEADKNPFRNHTEQHLKYMMAMPGININTPKEDLKKSDDFRKRMFGKLKKDDKSKSNPYIPAKSFNLPANFDWRTTDIGKKCMGTVMNQGSCGCCYSFATASSFSMRLCAVTNGPQVDYSPQDILACNKRTLVCNGGVIDIAYNYLEEYGIAPLSCMPYAEVNTPDGQQIPSQACNSVSCPVTGVPFTKAFCKKGTSVTLSGQDKIQNEILNRGPVATQMTVWSDLMNYQSGIYKQTTGTAQGGHAVTLMGWGNANGTNYWIVQNSWGNDFGEKGYFRIDMTDTNSAIAGSAYYCVPDA